MSTDSFNLNDTLATPRSGLPPSFGPNTRRRSTLQDLRSVVVHPLDGCAVGPVARRFDLAADLAELHFPTAQERGGDTLVAIVTGIGPAQPNDVVSIYGPRGDAPLESIRVPTGAYEIPAARGPDGARGYFPISAGASASMSRKLCWPTRPASISSAWVSTTVRISRSRRPRWCWRRLRPAPNASGLGPR